MILRRVLAALGLLAVVAVPLAQPASAASRTVHASGLTPYLVIRANSVHGHLARFRAYYPDGYVHGSLIPSNVHLTGMEHYTCVNPEAGPHRPPCAFSGAGNDVALGSDPENLGTLGQALTGVNHNHVIDFHTAGVGQVLQWRTYEHGPHTEFELTFTDGFDLYVVLDHPTHVADVQFLRAPADSTAASVAADTW